MTNGIRQLLELGKKRFWLTAIIRLSDSKIFHLSIPECLPVEYIVLVSQKGQMSCRDQVMWGRSQRDRRKEQNWQPGCARWQT